MLFDLCEVRYKLLYIFKTKSDKSHPLKANETRQIHWKQQWNNNVVFPNLVISPLKPQFCLPIPPRAFFPSFSYAFYRVTAKLYIYRSFATTAPQLKICDFFQEKFLKVLKCYSFLWVQRRHNCSPAASFANCVMTLYMLKVHLQTFLSITITKKCQILSCDILVANERYVHCCFQCRLLFHFLVMIRIYRKGSRQHCGEAAIV
jgi:hypothetical protein